MFKLPEINSEIAKKEITDFIKEIVSESKANGIIVGLSGGIDSSVVGYLAVEAVGKENVFGVHMYSKTTPKEDKDHAKLMSELLDIEYKEISIDTISDEFLKISDSANFNQKNAKLANGNLKARIRMSLLYYYGNLKNYIVIGTGNKSEILIGYFTKFGDGGCDMEPIGDIYKTQLRKLAHDWNIPKPIITKPPRAGLWPGQKDEDEIGLSYEVLDSILYMAIDENLENKDIIENIDISSSEIDNIREKVKNNQHKSEIPPSPIGSGKSF